MTQPMFLPVLAALTLATGAAGAADPRDALLARYAAEARQADPNFQGFDAARGRALYFGPHAGGRNPQLGACAACHTKDPRQTGQHVESKRSIDPMAASANPARFTKDTKVEKRFTRDCPDVIGRACTAQEKGDFITYLLGL